LVRFVDPEQNLRTLNRSRVPVDEPLYHLPSCEVLHQHERPLQGDDYPFDIDASFETIGCLCGNSELLGASADGDWVEVGAFNEYVCGLFEDFRIQAPHDPCNGNGSFAVADHQVVPAQGMGFSIESREGLTLRCPPHDDSVLFQPVVIKGVEGLPEFQEHEVGYIHHVVDGPQPRDMQPVSHPEGRRPDLHASDHACCVPGATFRVFHIHPGKIRDQSILFMDPDLGSLELPAGECRNFSCYADYGSTVRPVRSNADFESPVRQRKSVGHALPGFHIPRENHDPGMVFCKPHFVFGQQHARGELPTDTGFLYGHPSGQPGAGKGKRGHGPLLDVGGAAYHREHSPPCVHLTNVQSIGFGMSFD